MLGSSTYAKVKTPVLAAMFVSLSRRVSVKESRLFGQDVWKNLWLL